MRLSIEYEMSGKYLPKDYRSGFISLVKKAIESSDPKLYEFYYTQRKLKPFTFSTYFPNLKGGENGKFEVGNKIRLNFSTSSLELASYFYNGFYKVRDFPLFENMIKLKDISIKKLDIIHSNDVTFKTASPVLISNKGSSEWYLLPGQVGFIDGLKFAIGEIAKEFLNRDGETQIEFTALQIKRKVVRHYNMDMSSFVGVFKLKSDPEILQLIYDVGLGVRRSQGFGMLEVVKQ